MRPKRRSLRVLRQDREANLAVTRAIGRTRVVLVPGGDVRDLALLVFEEARIALGPPPIDEVKFVVEKLGGESPKDDAFANGAAWASGYLSEGAVLANGYSIPTKPR